MTTLRYVPSMIGVITPLGFRKVVVTSIVIYREGSHKGAIRQDYKAVEIKTQYGSRWYGSTEAYIDSTLQVAIRVDDRDEVTRQWESVKA